MKKTVLIIVALFAAVMVFSPVVRAQGPAAPPAVTCSGQEAAFFADNYVFGLQGDNGFCSVRMYYANTQAEALDCARKACPNCTVEDLTGLSKFSSSGQGINDTGNYCPARR